eukprot:scaffold13016_cov38-Cyclotella_meneghiniana.AAC.1
MKRNRLILELSKSFENIILLESSGPPSTTSTKANNTSSRYGTSAKPIDHKYCVESVPTRDMDYGLQKRQIKDESLSNK